CSCRNGLKFHSGIVASVTSVSALTVALRPSWSSSAISPNESPGPSFRLRPLAVLTVTVPSVMIMKPTPPSPRTTISCPAGCLTTLSCFSIERSSESGRPWNSFACLLSTTPEYYAPAVGLHKNHFEPSQTHVSAKGCGWLNDPPWRTTWPVASSCAIPTSARGLGPPVSVRSVHRVPSHVMVYLAGSL